MGVLKNDPPKIALIFPCDMHQHMAPEFGPVSPENLPLGLGFLGFTSGFHVCFCEGRALQLLLMAEILHHLGDIKPYK